MTYPHSGAGGIVVDAVQVDKAEFRDWGAALEAFAGVAFDSVADLLAETVLTYTTTPGPLTVVAAGDVIATRDGHSYTVAASAASDHDLTTAGGIRLYVRPGPAGYSLRAFGAALDSTTDDSAELTAALTRVVTTNGTLLVDGIARLASAVTCALAAEDHIAVVGSGTRSSGFLVDNATGGVDFDGSAVRSHSVALRNLGFFPNSDGAGYPFRIRGLEGGAQDNRGAEVINVHVGPVDDTLAFSFSAGPSVTGMFRPLCSNLIVTQGSASTTKMTHLLDTDGSYKPAFAAECYLKATAASGGATVGWIGDGDAPEDFTALPLTINGADDGWIIRNTTREPGGILLAPHINSRQRNIVIDGLKYATIFAPVLYADNAVTSFVDIDVIDADGVQILDPVFRGSASLARRHVRMDPASPEVVRNIMIRASGHFANTSVAPYLVGSEVDNCQIVLGKFVSAVDSASYPSELVEVETGAENIMVIRPDELRVYDDGATAGPLMRYVRRSTTPAVSDVLGEIDFVGQDSTAAEAIYAAIRALIRDATNGSEDGALQLYAMIAGTITQVASFEAASASDQTMLFLLTNRGGTVTLQRVKVGATNSAGTGLRALAVDN